jgi:hypothetical protein
MGSSAEPKALELAGRELGPLERWYWLFDKVAPLNGLARCRVEGELTTEALAEALRGMQLRHPLLRARIVANEKGERPRYIIEDELPVEIRREAIESSDTPEEDWVDVVRETVLNTGFETEQGPLLRLIVLDNSSGGTDLIAYGHHAIMDAAGAMAFFKELLERTQGIGCDAEPLPLMPSFADRFPRQQNGAFAFMRTLWVQAKREVATFFAPPTRLTADQPVPFSERRTDFIHHRLNQEQTAALVEACKAHGVSVHSSLCAALLEAMVDDIHRREEAPKERPLRLGIGSPVTLRDELDPPGKPEEMGIFVGSYMTVTKNVNKREFWDLARDVMEDLRAQAGRQEALTVLNFVRTAMPKSVAKAGGFMKLIDSKGPGNACISNLGRYDFPRSIGALTVSGVQMVAEISVTGTWVGVVNTCHGELVWNFSYTQGIFTRERALRLADTCIQNLLARLGS